MVLIERSVETPKSPIITARSLVGPTSGRPCRHDDLKKASIQLCPVAEDTQQYLERERRMERSSIVVETNNDEAGEIMLILNTWSVETPRYPA
jgi:hypothetical protein